MASETTARKWWDRWVVGFWAGIALASVAYPFIHPPQVNITRPTEADLDHVAQMILLALPHVNEDHPHD